MENEKWYRVESAVDIDSPALLIYPERVRQNIEKMIAYVGDPNRLMPHVKTIKMSEVVKLELKAGIENFKCATISEAEMLAQTKCLSKKNFDSKELRVKSVLIAYQLNETKIRRLINLIRKYPEVKFASLIDNLESAKLLNQIFLDNHLKINVYIDLDSGMHRTGFPIEKDFFDFFSKLRSLSQMDILGVHVYDGHLNDSDPHVRKVKCDEEFSLIYKKVKEVETKFGINLQIVAGGSPTLPFHATRKEVICSPGTTVLWDYGYSTAFPELPFIPSVVILARIISKSTGNFFTLDLGYKSVASENSLDKRIFILNLSDYKLVGQSEEHLVVHISRPIPNELKIGGAIYALPYHVCPTVSLYDVVNVIENRQFVGNWRVEARGRKITV